MLRQQPAWRVEGTYIAGIVKRGPAVTCIATTISIPFAVSMKRPLRWGVRCAPVGFGVALALVALAYGLNAVHVHYDLDVVYLILWPVSLGLMATENASVGGQVTIVLILSIMNATIYFAIGFLAGCLADSKGPRAG